jgi:hypothetical protein
MTSGARENKINAMAFCDMMFDQNRCSGGSVEREDSGDR